MAADTSVTRPNQGPVHGESSNDVVARRLPDIAGTSDPRQQQIALRLRGLLLTALAPLVWIVSSPVSGQSVPSQVAPSTIPVESPTANVSDPTLRFVPHFEINERYSDNAALVSSEFAKRDWMTDIAAGLHLEYRAKRANAYLDYRVNRILHGELSALNSTQHRLESNANLEAVEKWLFLDVRANIAQQNRSAFGAANNSDITNSHANRIETSSYQISPFVRGSLGSAADYMLRVNGAELHTGESSFPDSRTVEWSGYLKNAASAGLFGWSIDGSSLSIDSDPVGRHTDSRLRATGTLEVDAQLHFSLSGGRESSDIDGQNRQTITTHGIGLEWSPSQRSQIVAVTQKRFFGNDYQFLLAHRTALTAWRFSAVREIVVPTTSNSSSVNSLLLDLIASTIPDPTQRAEAVRQRFERTGMPSSSGIQYNSVTSQPSLTQRQEMSLVLLGLRNTLTLALGRREQRALSGNHLASAIGAPIEQFRQLAVNATWAYRLSPVSTLRIVVSNLRTRGLVTHDLASTQRLQSLVFVTRLGPQTSTSIGVQKTQFDSTVLPSFRESAVLSSISFRF